MQSKPPVLEAIILAAGRGNRLSESNPDLRPKCLLEIGGRSLISRMLENLAGCGVHHCSVVIGYEGDQIINHVGTLSVRTRISFHYNPRFNEGSVISLETARESLTAGNDVLLLDADVLFHPGILDRLVSSDIDNCFLVDRDFEPGAEPVKIAIDQGRMVEFRKKLPASLKFDALGESVGFFRFGPDCAQKIADRCSKFDADGRASEPHEEVLREELLERPMDFGFEDITGFPWLEIDFAEDLARASDQILPAIQVDHPDF